MRTFHVYGKPATQGSKVRTKWGIREDNPKLHQWRQQTAEVAREHYDEPTTENVGVGLVFFRPHTKGHYGTGRNSGKLKDSAPKEPGTTPDIDKLARAVHDAMKGIAYRDDSLIVTAINLKRWGNAAGVFVAVGTPAELEAMTPALLERMARQEPNSQQTGE